ncbi:MAG: SUF system NifU family Fe-S cluster assembly protein [bacterium]|nr:SUF system NifU family Fe-S cluster assembly protein [bacterium]
MSLYHEEILEHFKDPQNFGLLKDATLTKTATNPTCGDNFTFTLRLDNDNKVEAVGFEGEGCAISTASASLLTEELKGKTVEEIQNLDKDFIMKMLGLELSPTRLKCALLPLEALTKQEPSN